VLPSYIILGDMCCLWQPIKSNRSNWSGRWKSGEKFSIR